MKSRLLITLAVLATFTGALAAKTPIQKARTHLENARSLLTQKEEGGGKRKRKATIPNVINALNDAEVSLQEARNNKGTTLNAALKFIAEAKAELEAAKAGAEAEHLNKAQKAIDEALKRVLQGIHAK